MHKSHIVCYLLKLGLDTFDSTIDSTATAPCAVSGGSSSSTFVSKYVTTTNVHEGGNEAKSFVQGIPDKNLLEAVLEKWTENRANKKLRKGFMERLLEEWGHFNWPALEKALQAFVTSSEDIKHPEQWIKKVYTNILLDVQHEPKPQSTQEVPQSNLSEKGQKRLRDYKAKKLWYSRAQKAFYPVDRYGKPNCRELCIGKADIPDAEIDKYEWRY